MNLTFVKWAETTTDAMVHVYAGDRKLGTLSFTRGQWDDIEAAGHVEIFVGHTFQDIEQRERLRKLREMGAAG